MDADGNLRLTMVRGREFPDDRLRLYQRLLESVPGIAEKSNFGSAYTAVIVWQKSCDGFANTLGDR